MAEEDKSLSELLVLQEGESLASTDLVYVVIDPSGTPRPRKISVEELVNVIDSKAGLFGDPVDKTIAGGIITLTSAQHYVALNGQADTDDELTGINKTGGGYLDNGHVVVLSGVAGLDHVITLVDSGNFRLQGVFSINNENDTITLIQRSEGVWVELTRANNG
jgi:hypothetical protein